jgi:hypothetical protein
MNEYVAVAKQASYTDLIPVNQAFSTMAPRSWAQGSRWDFLNSRGPKYILACKDQTKHQWLENLYHDWFEIYHVSLPDDVEPVPGTIYDELTDIEAMRDNEKMLTKKRRVCVIPTRDI